MFVPGQAAPIVTVLLRLYPRPRATTGTTVATSTICRALAPTQRVLALVTRPEISAVHKDVADNDRHEQHRQGQRQQRQDSSSLHVNTPFVDAPASFAARTPRAAPQPTEVGNLRIVAPVSGPIAARPRAGIRPAGCPQGHIGGPMFHPVRQNEIIVYPPLIDLSNRFFVWSVSPTSARVGSPMPGRQVKRPRVTVLVVCWAGVLAVPANRVSLP